MSLYTEELERARLEFPRFSVIARDHSWLKPVFWALSKVTRMNYDSFTTTIGSTMYVGAAWTGVGDESRYKTLRHELVHVRQFHRWPLGKHFPAMNHILVGLCYILLLPVLWTFRAKFEREAYTETFLVEAELHGGLIASERMEINARRMAEIFGGSAYFYMWTKKKAYAWAMDVQREINAGNIVPRRAA